MDLSEILELDYILVRHLRFTYQDVKKMPFLKKLNFYNLWEKEQEERKRIMEEEMSEQQQEIQESQIDIPTEFSEE